MHACMYPFSIMALGHNRTCCKCFEQKEKKKPKKQKQAMPHMCDIKRENFLIYFNFVLRIFRIVLLLFRAEEAKNCRKN